MISVWEEQKLLKLRDPVLQGATTHPSYPGAGATKLSKRRVLQFDKIAQFLSLPGKAQILKLKCSHSNLKLFKIEPGFGEAPKTRSA